MTFSFRVEKNEKLPCVPRRSGVHMADSNRPLNFSGGNVIGMRRIVQSTWCCPRIFQNGTLLRRRSTVGLLSGIRYRPIFSTLRGLFTRDEESSGR